MKEWNCQNWNKRVDEVLDHNLPGTRDAREIDCPIPINELRQIPHELRRLISRQSNPKFTGRMDEEPLQVLFMFHVEHLREPISEVKTEYRLSEPKRERMRFVFYSSPARREEVR